jgi:hypothetical protein
MRAYVGMTVVYHQNRSEKIVQERGGYNGHRDHPAIVTGVHGDGSCVNLKVLFDCGPVEDRTSVSRLDPDLVGNGGWVPTAEK